MNRYLIGFEINLNTTMPNVLLPNLIRGSDSTDNTVTWNVYVVFV